MKTSLALAALAVAVNAVPEPITIPLTARRAPRSQARSPAWKTRAAAVDAPLTDWINGTDLQWYSKINVGTPPQHFNLLFDTGSPDILIPRNNCTTCGTHKLFNPARSRTFSAAPNIDVPFAFVTGADQLPLVDAAAGSGHGGAVTDVVRLGDLSNPAQVLVLGDVFPEIFTNMIPDGVLGLAPVNASSLPGVMPFYWHLWYSGQLASPTFSWYVTPERKHGAEVTLGGINSRRYSGPLTNVTLNTTVSAQSGRWVADQFGVFLNGRQALNSTSGQPFVQAVSALDTGTAFIQPPDAATTRDLYAAISPKIQPVGPYGSWGAPCAVLDAVAVDVTFQLGPRGEFNATVPKASFNLGPFPGQTELCEGVFVAPFGGTFDPYPPLSVWVLGSPLLKNYFTTWEGLKYEVGFAKPKHH